MISLLKNNGPGRGLHNKAQPAIALKQK